MYNDFSISLMKKYGWKEGEGLGKQSQGISKPVRANLKFNSKGIGFQEVSIDQDSKWSNMYSSALSNLNVEKNNSGKLSTSTTKDIQYLYGYKPLSLGFKKSLVFIKDGKEVNNIEDKQKSNENLVAEEEKNNNSEILKIQKSKKVKDIIVAASDSDKPANRIIKNEEKSKKRKSRKILVESEEYDIKVKKTKRIKIEIVSENTSNQTDIISKKSKKKNVEKEEIIDKTSEFETGEEVDVNKKDHKVKKVRNSENNDMNKFENASDAKNTKKVKKSKSILIDVDNLILPTSSSMTCHPSARFGLGMSGKLARVQKLYEQEKLEKLKKIDFI